MRMSFILIFIAFLAACATTPQRELEKVQPGWDKDQVLGRAGDPKRTFRANSQDHWIYVFFENGEEKAQQVDFADGKVVKVNPPRSKLSLENALESTQSMEEFEAKAREHQRKKSKFKDVDGEKPQP